MFWYKKIVDGYLSHTVSWNYCKINQYCVKTFFACEYIRLTQPGYTALLYPMTLTVYGEASVTDTVVETSCCNKWARQMGRRRSVDVNATAGWSVEITHYTSSWHWQGMNPSFCVRAASIRRLSVNACICVNQQGLSLAIHCTIGVVICRPVRLIDQSINHVRFIV